MTDEEVIAVHRDYVETHKKAFRLAYDALMKLWPPKADPEWFQSVAYPVCAAPYADPEADPLTKELMMAVYEYLGHMAPGLGKTGEDAT